MNTPLETPAKMLQNDQKTTQGATVPEPSQNGYSRLSFDLLVNFQELEGIGHMPWRALRLNVPDVGFVQQFHLPF